MPAISPTSLIQFENLGQVLDFASCELFVEQSLWSVPSFILFRGPAECVPTLSVILGSKSNFQSGMVL